MKRALGAAALLSLLTLNTGTARGGEQDDIENRINAEHADISDLEHLDEQHIAQGDITLLKAWLDEAWIVRLKHDYDRVREILDRTLSLEELIRQEIVASKLAAEVKRREVALQGLRVKIAGVRSALQKVKTDEKAVGATAR